MSGKGEKGEYMGPPALAIKVLNAETVLSDLVGFLKG
jgi:hypothetical protein